MQLQRRVEVLTGSSESVHIGNREVLCNKDYNVVRKLCNGWSHIAVGEMSFRWYVVCWRYVIY